MSCKNCRALERRMAEVERRLNNMFIRASAHKTESDEATIRVSDGSGFESGSVEYFQGRSGKNASWSPIDEGEQGLLLCPSGDPAQGIFLGGLPSQNSPAISANQDEQRTNFGDGSYMSYDRSSRSAVLNLGNNANITITTTDWTGDVNITGNVHITGMLDVTKTATVGASLTVGGGITFGKGVGGATRSARSASVLAGTGNIDLIGSITASEDIETTSGDLKVAGATDGKSRGFKEHTHTGNGPGSLTSIPSGFKTES